MAWTRLPLLAAPLALAAAPLLAQEWVHEYLPAADGAELSVCTAGIHYDDGPVVLRLYDETLDFYLVDEELDLPGGSVLGEVAFVFGSGAFTLAASTAADASGRRVQDMYLTPVEADYSALLKAVAGGGEFDIVFPDDLTYTISLAGSSAAVRAAFDCWTEHRTGRQGIDPFTGASDVNPFR